MLSNDDNKQPQFLSQDGINTEIFPLQSLK